MSDTSDDEAHLATLAGLYALDALVGDDRDRFEALLATDPELRHEVDEYRATAARLADVTATAPGPDLRDRVLAQVAVTRQDPPVLGSGGRRGAAPAARRWLAAAAAVVVLAGVALGGYALGHRGDTGTTRATAPTTTASGLAGVLSRPDAEVVPLVSAQGEPAGRLVTSKSAGRVVIVADGVARPAPGRTYEVWRVDGSGGARSAGLFEPGPDGRVEVALDVALEGAVALAVTDEPDGGSPSATTPVLLQARLT